VHRAHGMTGSDDYPRYASHYLPRTRAGRIAILAFLALLLLAEPPIVFVFANRIEPRFAGVPFLYAYLLVVYIAMIVVLAIGARRVR